MALKKKLVPQDSLLNAVARKLGRAAGTLTKATHDLADNVSAFPENVVATVRDVAGAAVAKQPKRRIRKSVKRVRSAAKAEAKKSKPRAVRRTAISKTRQSNRRRTPKR